MNCQIKMLQRLFKLWKIRIRIRMIRSIRHKALIHNLKLARPSKQNKKRIRRRHHRVSQRLRIKRLRNQRRKSRVLRTKLQLKNQRRRSRVLQIKQLRNPKKKIKMAHPLVWRRNCQMIKRNWKQWSSQIKWIPYWSLVRHTLERSSLPRHLYLFSWSCFIKVWSKTMLGIRRCLHRTNSFSFRLWTQMVPSTWSNSSSIRVRLLTNVRIWTLTWLPCAVMKMEVLI